MGGGKRKKRRKRIGVRRGKFRQGGQYRKENKNYQARHSRGMRTFVQSRDGLFPRIPAVVSLLAPGLAGSHLGLAPQRLPTGTRLISLLLLPLRIIPQTYPSPSPCLRRLSLTEVPPGRTGISTFYAPTENGRNKRSPRGSVCTTSPFLEISARLAIDNSGFSGTTGTPYFMTSEAQGGGLRLLSSWQRMTSRETLKRITALSQIMQSLGPHTPRRRKGSPSGKPACCYWRSPGGPSLRKTGSPRQRVSGASK